MSVQSIIGATDRVTPSAICGLRGLGPVGTGVSGDCIAGVPGLLAEAEGAGVKARRPPAPRIIARIRPCLAACPLPRSATRMVRTGYPATAGPSVLMDSAVTTQRDPFHLQVTRCLPLTRIRLPSDSTVASNSPSS